MLEAIKDSENLFQVLDSFMNFPHHKTGDEMFFGALTCLLATWLRLKKAGFSATTQEAELMPVLQGSSSRVSLEMMLGLQTKGKAFFMRQTQALCSAVSQSKMNVPFDVKVFNEPADAGAIPFRLVSSPDRVSVQTVQRDSDMEIVSTIIRETDAR